jgi:hypothetical protein
MSLSHACSSAVSQFINMSLLNQCLRKKSFCGRRKESAGSERQGRPLSLPVHATSAASSFPGAGLGHQNGAKWLTALSIMLIIAVFFSSLVSFQFSILG